MKKIISLLSAVAILLSMTVVAFADENNKLYFEEVSKTDTELVLNLVLETNQTINSSGAALDLADAVAAGAKATGTQGAAMVFNVDDTNAKVISYSLTSTTGETGKIVLGTVTFDLSKVTSDFTLPQKKAMTAKSGKTNVASSFTNEAVGYAISAPVVTPPEPEKFEAKVSGDEITFENADLSTANKEIGGKAIKIFGKTFTVNAKSKFVISAKGTTKTFGKTAAEYLGLEGDGEATGNVTVGIIYDKEQYSADDFTIAAE